MKKLSNDNKYALKVLGILLIIEAIVLFFIL